MDFINYYDGEVYTSHYFNNLIKHMGTTTKEEEKRAPTEGREERT